MTLRRLTLLQILEAALGSEYGPGFRRRLKRNLPRDLWLLVSQKKVGVPAEGTREWEELKQAALAWMVDGAVLVQEDLRRAGVVVTWRN